MAGLVPACPGHPRPRLWVHAGDECPERNRCLDSSSGTNSSAGGLARHQADRQDLFLRSRNSPSTSAALLPFMRTLAATDGSSARTKTLAFFSSPSRGGTGGLLAAPSRRTSSARAFKAALSGSTLRANLTFAAVYSWPQ